MIDATPGPSLDDLGEDGVLERILARIPAPPAAAGLEVGPGDDAAVSRPHGRLVTTTDMLVEGEDFLASWLDPRLLGRKAAAQNLADVCAMGATPHGLVLSIGAPGTTPVRLLEEIMTGFAAEAERAGAGVFGGDLSGGPCLVISVTALGVLEGQPVLRSGARDGDAIVLAGTVGRAAAGLDLLFAGTRPGEETLAPELEALIDAQRGPGPDYDAVARLMESADSPADPPAAGAQVPASGTQNTTGPLAPDAHAMIDVSDGLVGDLGRITRASGVAADLDPAALDALARPLLPAARALAPQATPAEHAARARQWVLTGGEDHGFLATMPPDAAPVGWTRIGSCHAGDPRVTVGGAPVHVRAFSHFSGDR